VRIRLADFEPSPDVFAAVMATGILSIAAGKHHYAEISEFLGLLAAVGLVVLIAVVSLTGAAALCIYALMTWLILWRAVAQRQNLVREEGAFEPDTWILMGGLAIATLAGDNIHSLAPAWLGRPVLAVTVVSWAVATLWIPPLIYFGLHRISQGPERLHFAGVWWALVFPPAMYSAASYAMAAELSRRSLITVSLVFFWDALAAWLIVVGAGLLHATTSCARRPGRRRWTGWCRPDAPG
jgi:tellurite resistance protein TehA-like permease